MGIDTVNDWVESKGVYSSFFPSNFPPRNSQKLSILDKFLMKIMKTFPASQPIFKNFPVTFWWEIRKRKNILPWLKYIHTYKLNNYAQN